MRVRNFNIEDFKEFYEEVKADLIEYGFKEIQEVKHILSLDLRGTKTYGRCKKMTSNALEATIYLNKTYADSTTIQRIKNTIMHELIHSIKGCSGHTGLWKQIAEIVSYRSQGKYDIKRLSTSCPDFRDTIIHEKGPQFKKYKYIITCTNCHKEFKYEREGQVVKNFKRGRSSGYRCPTCRKSSFELKIL